MGARPVANDVASGVVGGGAGFFAILTRAFFAFPIAAAISPGAGIGLLRDGWISESPVRGDGAGFGTTEVEEEVAAAEVCDF